MKFYKQDYLNQIMGYKKQYPEIVNANIYNNVMYYHNIKGVLASECLLMLVDYIYAEKYGKKGNN